MPRIALAPRCDDSFKVNTELVSFKIITGQGFLPIPSVLGRIIHIPKWYSAPGKVENFRIKRDSHRAEL